MRAVGASPWVAPLIQVSDSPLKTANLQDLYRIGYNVLVKPVRFLGDSRKVLREFPKGARHEAGYQLERIQRGLPATDFKPMHPIGTGVEEIRISEGSGAYRVLYTARLAEAVYVIHAFQKKTKATSQRDVDIARERFRQLMRGR